MIDKFDGEYFFLSNFYELEVPVTVNGMEFETVESAFQASKTLDKEEQRKFTYRTPGASKRFGRMVKLREDWPLVKEDIMLNLLIQKFSKNPVLQELLINTGHEELVEGNYWNDTYWGVCNGVGENKLGILLMNIRGTLM